MDDGFLDSIFVLDWTVLIELDNKFNNEFFYIIDLKIR